jgi:NAD(P)-dependent dehydrogenase (short-subunit alcohol dehydrogenase family)
LDVSEEGFDAVIRVNLKGSFLMAQAAARAMVANKTQGNIINMSSVNGVLAIPSIASYNMSKGGINQLTRVAALALADHGIRVNAVAPGTIATELAQKAVLTDEDAPLGCTFRNCRCGGMAGQRCSELHHRRDRDCGWRAHGTELHRLKPRYFPFASIANQPEEHVCRA